MKPLREITDENVKKRSELTHDQMFPHYQNYDDVEHKLHLRDYQTDSSDLNNYHWEKHKNSPHYQSWAQNIKDDKEYQTAKLDAALSHHKTPHKLAVYSGTANDPRRHMNEEGIVHHPAYLSTSLDPAIARGFASSNREYRLEENELHTHLLKIHVPKGHPGAYVAHIKNHGEKEFILPRGTKLKHIKTDTEQYSPGSTKKFFKHVHHMKVVE